MSDYSPTDLAAQLKSGLLSFPVTHFTDDLQFDEEGYRKHLAWLAEYPVAGLFAAGGTGEGFSLTFEETDRVLRTAVEEVAGTVPVLAPATGSTANAVAQAKAAEAAGADGLLLMPPYLTEASQAGLVEHVSQVCAATDLGVVVYSRANAVLRDEAVATLADRNPTLIGFKDGVGNIEQMTRIYARVGDRLTYVGGLPTAETFALPLLQLGVSTYSSALFNFAARVGDRVLRRRACPGPRRGLPSAQRVRHPLPRHPRPDPGLRRLDRQGRADGRRPPRRPGPSAADGPDRAGGRRARRPDPAHQLRPGRDCTA